MKPLGLVSTLELCNAIILIFQAFAFGEWVQLVCRYGWVCSALARMEISIVSGIISTGTDGGVRNTMYVQRRTAAAAPSSALNADGGGGGVGYGGALHVESS